MIKNQQTSRIQIPKTPTQNKRKETSPSFLPSNRRARPADELLVVHFVLSLLLGLAAADDPEDAGEDKEREKEDDDGDGEVGLGWRHVVGKSRAFWGGWEGIND